LRVVLVPGYRILGSAWYGILQLLTTGVIYVLVERRYLAVARVGAGAKK